MALIDNRGNNQPNNQGDDLERILNTICREYNVAGADRGEFMRNASEHFPPLLDALLPLVRRDQQTDLICTIFLNILGETFKVFTDRGGNLYSRDVDTAMDDVEDLLNKRERDVGLQRSNPRSDDRFRDTRHSNVNSLSQRSSLINRGIPNSSSTAHLNHINRSPIEGLDVFESNDYKRGAEAIPHEVSPFKVKHTGPRVSSDVRRKVIVLPSVLDNTELFDENYNFSEENAGEISFNTSQLVNITEARVKESPVLTKFWVEEHMPWGHSVSKEHCDEITSVFSAFKTVSDFDVLIDLIQTLIKYGRTATVSWLTNRVSDELLEFLARNYNIDDQESFLILTKTIPTIEYLDERNIRMIVLDKTIRIVNRIFQRWTYLEVSPAVEGPMDADKEISTLVNVPSPIIILKHSAHLLILPYITYYRKISETFIIMNQGIESEILNPLLQRIFTKLKVGEDELFIVDDCFHLYSTFRWQDENDECDFERVIKKISI